MGIANSIRQYFVVSWWYQYRRPVDTLWYHDTVEYHDTDDDALSFNFLD